MDLNKLKEPLKVDNIDFRVSHIVSFGGQVYAFLLAYKDARVDMEVLDQAVGQMNWQVEYKRDSKGVLQCGIGIYSSELSQWVWKWSNGVESFTEAVKGEYSDALKRAGFMWGIGRKLYDFPNIRVIMNEKEYKQDGQRYKQTGYFKPNEWSWEVSEDYKTVIAKDKTGAIRFNSNPNKK